MKKLLSMMLVVLMLVGMLPMGILGASAADGVTTPDEAVQADSAVTYVKTDLADIESTDQVIIVGTKEGKSYAMSNDKGSSSPPIPVAVTITDDSLSTDATNIFWNISNDNGDLTIYPAGTTNTWLYCTNSNNGVRVGTNANKVFTIDSSSGYLKNTATSRYLGIYDTKDWRCYTSSTATNINGQSFAFYVESSGSTGGEGGETTECSHENTTEKAEVFATCTEAGYTAGTYCGDCETYISGHETIEAKGHIAGDNGSCTGCHTHIVELAYQLATDEELRGNPFTLTGEIISIDTAYSADYKNITVTIKVAGYENKPIKCYRLKAGTGYGDTDTAGLLVGDTITVSGNLKKYKGNVQFDSNCTFTDLKSTHTHNHVPKTTEPTCTADGYITYTCECGNQYQEPGKSATGHSYVSGTCSGCGAKEPVVENWRKVTTAPTDWSGTYIIVYEAENLIFDGSLEKLDAVGDSQSVTVNNGEISTSTAYAFTIAQVEGGYSIKSASGVYIGKSSNSNGMDESPNNAYVNTISLNDDGSVNIIGVGGAYLRYNATSGQDRFRYFKSTTYSDQKAIALYQLIEASICEHNYVESVTKYATCTETGVMTYTCSKCNDSYTTVIDKIDHNYGENGYCIYGCGAMAPIVNNQKYYIATTRGSSNYWYMTNVDVDDNDKHDAENSNLTALPASIEIAEKNKVFIAIKNDDNTWSFATNDSAGNTKYLGYSGKNSGVLVAKDKAIKFTVQEKANGTVNISFMENETTERFLSLNEQTGSDFFAWYTGTQKQDLTLIPVNNCTEHKAETLAAVEPTCTAIGLTEGSQCSACGEVLVAQTERPALGHTMEADDEGIYSCSTCNKAPAITDSALVLNSTLLLKLIVDRQNDEFATADCRIHVTIGSDETYQDLAVSTEPQIPAHRLYEDVKIELLYKGQLVDVKTWKLTTYTAGLRETNQGDAKMMALLDALEDYATYAAVYAGSSTVIPDEDAVKAIKDISANTLVGYKQKIGEGSTYAPLKPNAGLYLDDACNIRVKFDATAWSESYTLTIDGEDVTVSGGVYTIEDLMPQDWNEAYEIVVKAGDTVVFSVDYSVMSYAYAALNSAQNVDLQNLMKAMYLYNVAAEDYVAPEA